MKIKKEYPKMMYKKGGLLIINGVGYTYKIIEDEQSKLDLIADGFFSSPAAADEIEKDIAKDVEKDVEKKSDLVVSYANKSTGYNKKSKRGRPKKG